MSEPNHKVLLVDDFEMARSLVRVELSRLGYRDVREAEEGRTAFEMLEAAEKEGCPYALVIADWNMPEVSGLQLLEKMRQHPAFRQTPFIMLTAEAEMASITRVMQAGANDYIVKPVNADSLAQKVNAILLKSARRSA